MTVDRKTVPWLEKWFCLSTGLIWLAPLIWLKGWLIEGRKLLQSSSSKENTILADCLALRDCTEALLKWSILSKHYTVLIISIRTIGKVAYVTCYHWFNNIWNHTMANWIEHTVQCLAQMIGAQPQIHCSWDTIEEQGRKTVLICLQIKMLSSWTIWLTLSYR